MIEADLHLQRRHNGVSLESQDSPLSDDLIGHLPAFLGQKRDRLGNFHFKSMVSIYDMTLLCLF